MRGLRFWLGLVAVAAGVSLLIVLLDVVVKLMQVSPLALVVLLLIVVFICLRWRFFRPPSPAPSIPQFPDKLTAAQANLTALEEQLQKIRDQVTQGALQEQTEKLRTTIERQELQVVVFGVGSAGKTSLVNALLGRAQGKIAATMGTTEIGVKYRPVQIGKSTVSLVDCPGILEAGEGGKEREELARRIATRADLLLFVIAEDLKQAEFQLLQELYHLGKKIVLVWNKIDLYTKSDQAAILAKIQERLQQAHLAIETVPIAAHPAPVSLPTGEIYQPPPKLAPLLATLADILTAQTKDLIADNVLLQCQTLTTEARSVITAEREQQTQAIIDRYQWLVAAAVVANPLPLVDFLATAAVHTQMVLDIAQVYDCQISWEDGQNLVKSLVQTMTGLGLTKTAMQILNATLTVNPLGVVVKNALGGITAAYLTRIAGRSFQAYFAQQGQWGDGGITAVVQQQFALAQKEELLQKFLQQTIAHLELN
ncbi:MAG: YcjF family protein [Pseudanabaenaceae cyanobacterium]